MADIPEPMMWPTTREVARRLEVSQPRVRQLILDGTLKTKRVGTLHVIDPESLAAYEKHRNSLDRDSRGRIIDGKRRSGRAMAGT